MTNEEAIEILENGGWWDLLIPITTIEGRSDEDKLHQAIDMALTALRSMPEAGEPLSLEQLRKMDGKPALIVPVNDKDWEPHWAVMNHRSFFADSKTERGKTYFLYEDTYGVTWLAYAYPPAHIDREAWEPCKCCREPIGTEPYAKEQYPGICEFEVILDGGDEITVNSYNHCTPLTEEVCFSFPVSFCPRCGRPLTPEAWAELERKLIK